jgi:hypothetical protein
MCDPHFLFKQFVDADVRIRHLGAIPVQHQHASLLPGQQRNVAQR